MININAVVGLAITTAFLRSDFDNQTTASEVEDQDAWDSIASLAMDYLKWANIEISDVSIDKYVISQSIWGYDTDELDEKLSDS